VLVASRHSLHTTALQIRHQGRHPPAGRVAEPQLTVRVLAPRPHLRRVHRHVIMLLPPCPAPRRGRRQLTQHAAHTQWQEQRRQQPKVVAPLAAGRRLGASSCCCSSSSSSSSDGGGGAGAAASTCLPGCPTRGAGANNRACRGGHRPSGRGCGCGRGRGGCRRHAASRTRRGGCAGRANGGRGSDRGGSGRGAAGRGGHPPCCCCCCCCCCCMRGGGGGGRRQDTRRCQP